MNGHEGMERIARMRTEEQRRRVFNIITVTQCLGMISGALFQNGFYLSYYSSLSIPSAAMMLLMLATIGLVPRVGNKVQLMPGGIYSRI